MATSLYSVIYTCAAGARRLVIGADDVPGAWIQAKAADAEALQLCSVTLISANPSIDYTAHDAAVEAAEGE